MSNQLLQAILSMDVYNREYNEGIKLEGALLGDATIIKTSDDFGAVTDANGNIILDGNGAQLRKDENIGFYAIAYEHQGEVIISYRGTDDGLLSKDFLHGFGVGTGTANAGQGIMAANLYRTAPCLH